MVKNEFFFQFKSLNRNFSKLIIVTVLILSILFTGIMITNIVQNSGKNSITQGVTTSNFPQSTVSPQVRQTVEKNLEKFTGGFIAQGLSGDQAIQYFIQNPTMLVGFGPSTVKILLKDSSSKNSPTYTEVTQTFINSNNINPIVKNPISSTGATYFIGSHIGKKIQQYSTLIFKNIYRNIDLEYIIKDGVLKYNFYINPGGNPNDILIKWAGPVNLVKMNYGIQVSVTTRLGEKTLIDTEPLAYQSSISNHVAVNFELLSSTTYSFKVGKYSPNSVLVIDPTIVELSTLFGGSLFDYGYGIAVDNVGNIYVTGYTASYDFPTFNAYNNTYDGANGDVFVFKLSPTGSLVYSTFVGGSNVDYGYGIAVDTYGFVYVTGYTQSSDFPTFKAYNSTFCGGQSDVFVFKLLPTGSSLAFSTFFGGTKADYGYAIVLDKYDDVTVTGYTASSDFLTYNAFNSTFGGAIDVFVFRLSSTGSYLIYSTFVGGSLYDWGSAIAVDSSLNVYVTGHTSSNNFPTVNAYNSTYGQAYDVFIFKLSANGSVLYYSTYLGGNNMDYGYGIAVDSSGEAYVTGFTSSGNFPTVNAYNSTYGNNSDIFIAKLSANGSSLLFSTYFGGTNLDYGMAITLDSNGIICVTGITESSDFPIMDTYNSSYHGGGYDIFVAKFSSNGSKLLYSTCIGGSTTDYGWAIAVDNNGNIYVAGYTYSYDFPTVNEYSNTFKGQTDVIVLKLSAISESILIPSEEMIIQSNSTHSLELVWNEPIFLNFFQNYIIYRATTTGTYSLVGSSSEAHFVDTYVTPGVSYNYIISANYSFNKAFNSSVFTGVLKILPSAPILTVSSGNRSAYLTWTIPNDGGSPIIEYQVFRGTEPGQYSFVGVTQNLHFNDTNLSGGTTYYYVVAAVNGLGKGAYSQEITTTPTGPSTLYHTVISSVTVTVYTSSTGTSGEQNSNHATSSHSKNTDGFGLVSVLIFFSFVSLIIISRKKRKI